MADLLEFVEVRFPEKIDFGVEGGPQFFTSIVTTVGGHEQRNINWEEGRARYTSRHRLKDQTDMDELIAFFRARRGKAVGFRFRDFVDWCSDMPAVIANPVPDVDSNSPLPPAGAMTHQAIGTGDGLEVDFQLIKTYSSGPTTEDFVRQIKKPADDSPGASSSTAAVRMFVDGVEQTIGVDYTVNSLTGVVTFTSAPGSGLAITADYFFDVPVRFDIDQMDVSLDTFDIESWDGIRIVEILV